MQHDLLFKLAIGLVLAIFAISTGSAPTNPAGAQSVKAMNLDPEGFVHIADDGIARSYSANGAVIDFAPLSNEQLLKMVKNLPSSLEADKEHLNELFANVSGFAVKDHEQIFNPPTQLRPAIDPDNTNWREDTNVNEAHEAKKSLENSDTMLIKNGDMPAACQGKHCRKNANCANIGCPGDSCYHLHRYFVRTCHDLSFRMPPK